MGRVGGQEIERLGTWGQRALLDLAGPGDPRTGECRTGEGAGDQAGARIQQEQAQVGPGELSGGQIGYLDEPRAKCPHTHLSNLPTQ